MTMPDELEIEHFKEEEIVALRARIAELEAAIERKDRALAAWVRFHTELLHNMEDGRAIEECEKVARRLTEEAK